MTDLLHLYRCWKFWEHCKTGHFQCTAESLRVKSTWLLQIAEHTIQFASKFCIFYSHSGTMILINFVLQAIEPFWYRLTALNESQNILFSSKWFEERCWKPLICRVHLRLLEKVNINLDVLAVAFTAGSAGSRLCKREVDLNHSCRSVKVGLASKSDYWGI